MSNTVHYIETTSVPVKRWKTLCGIHAMYREIDVTTDPKHVECVKCRELLAGERNEENS